MRDDFSELLKVLVLAAGARAIYDASRPSEPEPLTCLCKLTATGEDDNLKPEPGELTSKLKRWAKKSARSYALAQERQWRNWEQAMFEGKPEAHKLIT